MADKDKFVNIADRQMMLDYVGMTESEVQEDD